MIFHPYKLTDQFEHVLSTQMDIPSVWPFPIESNSITSWLINSSNVEKWWLKNVPWYNTAMEGNILLVALEEVPVLPWLWSVGSHWGNSTLIRLIHQLLQSYGMKTIMKFMFQGTPTQYPSSKLKPNKKLKISNLMTMYGLFIMTRMGRKCLLQLENKFMLLNKIEA